MGCLSKNFASSPVILYMFSVLLGRGTDAEGCSQNSWTILSNAGRKERLGGDDLSLIMSPKIRSSPGGAGSSTGILSVLASLESICA